MQASPGDIFIFPGSSCAKSLPTENDQIFIKTPMLPSKRAPCSRVGERLPMDQKSEEALRKGNRVKNKGSESKPTGLIIAGEAT